jgi:predicted ester cyclase
MNRATSAFFSARTSVSAAPIWRDRNTLARRVTTDDHKAAAARLHEEAFGNGQLGVADELVAPGCAGHTPELREFTGAEGFKRAVGELRDTLSDVEMTVTEQFAEGDRVVTVFTIRGAHTGRYQRTRPTQKRFEIGGAAFTRHEGDWITEYWAEWDRRALLEQLEVVPVVAGSAGDPPPQATV